MLSGLILHTIYLKKLVALILLAEIYVTLQQDKPKIVLESAKFKKLWKEFMIIICVVLI